jgi:plastocyanin
MIRSTIHFAVGTLLIGSLFAATGCDYDSPTAPGSSTPGPEGAVISIGASGLTPGTVTIPTGQSVTFVNTDTVAHEIASTPVPTYDDCPPINRVSRLEPGQSMQTGALTAMRTCGFVDLLRIGDARWQGSITVQ